MASSCEAVGGVEVLVMITMGAISKRTGSATLIVCTGGEVKGGGKFLARIVLTNYLPTAAHVLAATVAKTSPQVKVVIMRA